MRKVLHARGIRHERDVHLREEPEPVQIFLKRLCRQMIGQQTADADVAGTDEALIIGDRTEVVAQRVADAGIRGGSARAADLPRALIICIAERAGAEFLIIWIIARIQRGRIGDALHDRARFIRGIAGDVEIRLDVMLVLVKGRIAAPAQDLSGLHLHDDGPGRLRIFIFHRIGQAALQRRLHVGIQREIDIIAVDRLFLHAAGARQLGAVRGKLILDGAVLAAQIFFQRLFQPHLSHDALLLFIIGRKSEQM